MHASAADLCYNDVSGLTKAVTTIKTLILCCWIPSLDTDCTAHRSSQALSLGEFSQSKIMVSVKLTDGKDPPQKHGEQRSQNMKHCLKK